MSGGGGGREGELVCRCILALGIQCYNSVFSLVLVNVYQTRENKPWKY